MFGFVWTISIIFGIAVFLLPTIVAIARHKRNTTAILILNLLAGWTFIGWIIALVWAFTADKEKS